MTERLSHAYCCDCDVFFWAAAICPRCEGTSLISPPRDSTVVVVPREKRSWIARQGWTPW